MSTQSFADLGVSRAVCRALNDRGVTRPFPVQALVTGDVLTGRDVLVRSPTGSGKTLAFGIPTVEWLAANAADTDTPASLILAPTRELACQIAEEIAPIARARSLRVATAYGGVGIQRQARAAAKAHILVATPGRLEDLLARRALRLDNVRILILDEADRMLDMGFRPAVDRIVALCPTDRQTLFFSATLAGESGRVAASLTKNAVRHELAPEPSARRAAIEHRFVEVRPDARLETLVTELSADRDLALVFVRTKRGADRLVKRLAASGVEAAAMHGDKSQGQRERALAHFESGRVKTLVATDVAARGIDVDRISHVINFDAPADGDTYTHRVGRTGRAGRSGIGITLHTADERSEVGRMAADLGLDCDLAASTSRRSHQPRTHTGPGPAGGRRRDRRRHGDSGPARPTSAPPHKASPAGRRSVGRKHGAASRTR